MSYTSSVDFDPDPESCGLLLRAVGTPGGFPGGAGGAPSGTREGGFGRALVFRKQHRVQTSTCLVIRRLVTIVCHPDMFLNLFQHAL